MIREELTYELVIEDESDEVYAVSLVSQPAIELGWVAFDKEEVKLQSIDEDKQLVMGPILIPDKRIIRVDGEGKTYHVFLKKNTIETLAQKYLKNKYNDAVTVEHENKRIDNVSLVESWIVESTTKDKSALYGFSVPIGTWMGIMKIDDKGLWDEVKSGKSLQGFSIEGLFSHQLAKYSMELELMEKNIDELTEDEARIILSKIKDMVEMESYSDYGDDIRNNAKRGIELNEKNGNKCATQTGKLRAQQLANGEPISLETIQRMYSFLSRAETYYDETDSTACGTISFLLWGGKAALSYSRNKLRELGEIELEEGVPHYTADGKLYEGPTHKDASGKLMTGEEHTDDSKFLYHREAFAEVGPRGGIKESPKAPKSDTKNPDPKGEGSAKGDASGKRGAKVTAEQEKTLQKKVDEFNEKDSNTKNGNATLGALKSVFQRGLGAFNTSRSPVVRSAEQWALARVNAFLYLLKNGRPENAKYTTDYDLLPKDHPKYSEKMEAQPSIPGSSYAGEPASGSIAPATFK